MANTHDTDAIPEPGLFLDISGEVCPLTFVRTKLLIESMKPGQIAEIRLQGPEPLANVPRAVSALGHLVVSIVPEDAGSEPNGIHRLTIRKAGARDDPAEVRHQPSASTNASTGRPASFR